MSICLKVTYAEGCEHYAFATEYASLDAARQAVDREGYVIKDIEYDPYLGGVIHFVLDRTYAPQPLLTGLTVPMIADLDAQILDLLKEPQNRLDMRDWHYCGTRHCRAGWAIVLAGSKGRALEKRYGPELAGLLLYEKAYPTAPLPDFFSCTLDALDDMRERAGRSDDDTD